ncbi:MAG: 3-methyl-2-oxobutanoate hydroxymethyltransferase, partial [Candidatus Cloacimonetes bacterium]|nr:3-methyl-2-oxobutanoate hydroxymethyltransferase [Candidatus Cloacimonadota bacterium]
DVLGMSDIKPKFVQSYANLENIIPSSLKKYIDDVKSFKFPAIDNVYQPIDK